MTLEGNLWRTESQHAGGDQQKELNVQSRVTQLGRQQCAQSEGILAEKRLDTGAHSDCSTQWKCNPRNLLNVEKKSKYKDAKRILKSAIWPRRVPAEGNTWKYNFCN